MLNTGRNYDVIVHAAVTAAYNFWNSKLQVSVMKDSSRETFFGIGIASYIIDRGQKKVAR